MRLQIHADLPALPVEGVGGVGEAVFRPLGEVGEQERVAALRRLGGLLGDHGVVFVQAFVEGAAARRGHGHVAVFGQHDQVEAVVALVDQAEHLAEAVLRVGVVHRVARLNHANLHGNIPLFYRFVASILVNWPGVVKGRGRMMNYG